MTKRVEDRRRIAFLAIGEDGWRRGLRHQPARRIGHRGPDGLGCPGTGQHRHHQFRDRVNSVDIPMIAHRFPFLRPAVPPLFPCVGPFFIELQRLGTQSPHQSVVQLPTHPAALAHQPPDRILMHFHQVGRRTDPIAFIQMFLVLL